jgi:hypothetical protein
MLSAEPLAMKRMKKNPNALMTAVLLIRSYWGQCRTKKVAVASRQPKPPRTQPPAQIVLVNQGDEEQQCENQCDVIEGSAQARVEGRTLLHHCA